MIINQYLGSGTSAGYQAVLDNATTRYIRRPSAAQQSAQDTFFRALQTAGIISLTDVLKVFATNGPIEFTSINWVNPSSNFGSRFKAPQFDRNLGFKFGGTTLLNHIDIGWAPSSGVNYTQNAGEMVFGYKDLTLGVFPDGVRDNGSGLNGSLLTPWNASSQALGALNGGQASVSNAQFNGADDLYFTGRTSSSSSFVRRGSNSRATYTSTSSGRSSLSMKLGLLDTAGSLSLHNTRRIQIFWAGGLLTTTQEDDFLTAWNAYLTAISTDPAVATLGTIHNQTSFPNLTGWVVNGVTPTISSNELQFTGGTGSFTQTLDLDRYTALERWSITMRARVGTKDASSNGFGVGVRSSNTSATYDTAVQFNMVSGAGSGITNIYTGNGGTYTLRGQTTAQSFSVGDVIEIKFTRSYNVLTVTSQNITTASSVLSQSFTYTTSPFMPNTSRFAIFNFGGTFNVTSFSITSDEVYEGAYAIVGDSKTQQYSATLFNLRYSSILTNHLGFGPVLAGGSDKTADVLNRVQEIIDLAPQNVILAIGSNDPRFGVASATTIANYDAIVSAITGAGIRVIHTTGYYETSGVNQATLQAHINSTYSSADIIDTLGTVISLNADTVHPDDAGHSTIANTILASGKL